MRTGPTPRVEDESAYRQHTIDSPSFVRFCNSLPKQPEEGPVERHHAAMQRQESAVQQSAADDVAQAGCMGCTAAGEACSPCSTAGSCSGAPQQGWRQEVVQSCPVEPPIMRFFLLSMFWPNLRSNVNRQCCTISMYRNKTAALRLLHCECKHIWDITVCVQINVLTPIA